MVRTRSAILGVLVVVSLAAIAIANDQLATPSVGFTELYRKEVAEPGDLEVVMGLITKEGASIGAKHYHPGGEFGFILEGAVIVTTEGKLPVTFKAGTSFYQPPGEWHAVTTASEGAKTVVFRVVERGQPMIVPVD